MLPVASSAVLGLAVLDTAERAIPDYITSASKLDQRAPKSQKRDVVLMKELEATRIQWPVVVMERCFPSEDGLVMCMYALLGTESLCCILDPQLN